MNVATRLVPFAVLLWFSTLAWAMPSGIGLGNPQPSYRTLLDSAKELRNTDGRRSLQLVNTLLELEELRADTLAWVEALATARYVHLQFGNYERGLYYTLEQQKLLAHSSDIAERIRLLENLAYNNYHLGFEEKASDYRRDAIALAQAKRVKNRTLALIYSNLGDYYREHKGDYDVALAYNDTAIQLSKELGLIADYAFFLANRSELFTAKKQYDAGLAYARQAEAIMDTITVNRYPLDEAFLYRCYGTLHRGMGDYELAISYFQKGLEIAKAYNSMKDLAFLYEELSLTEEQRENMSAALAMQKSFKLYSDSLKRLESHKKAIGMQIQFENEQKEQQIAILSENKNLSETAVQRQELISLLLGILLTIIFVFFLVLYRNYESRRRTLVRLQQQNHEIQAKNEEIQAQKTSIESQNVLLEQKNIELDELNRENANLIGIAAHDLKAPLKQINGLVTIIMLEGANLKESQRECLTRISESSRRASELIGKILDLDAIEANRNNLDLQPHSLNSLVQTATHAYTDAAEKKHIRLNFEEVNANLLVRIDQSYGLQIIENLLSNAIKFSPFGKHIFIRLKGDANQAHFEIQDEGPGIAPEEMGKLFGKFQKLSARPTGGETSSGLGLAIVKKYAEAMGGTVTCRSSKGQGATFTLTFARIEESTAAL